MPLIAQEGRDNVLNLWKIAKTRENLQKRTSSLGNELFQTRLPPRTQHKFTSWFPHRTGNGAGLTAPHQHRAKIELLHFPNRKPMKIWLCTRNGVGNKTSPRFFTRECGAMFRDEREISGCAIVRCNSIPAGKRTANFQVFSRSSLWDRAQSERHENFSVAEVYSVSESLQSWRQSNFLQARTKRQTVLPRVIVIQQDRNAT